MALIFIKALGIVKNTALCWLEITKFKCTHAARKKIVSKGIKAGEQTALIENVPIGVRTGSAVRISPCVTTT